MMSFLKKLGLAIAKVVGVVQKVEPTVEKITIALLPQFAPAIESLGTLVQNILQEIVAAETAAAAAGQTGTGAQKLAAVTAKIGPVMDDWVSSNFPGAAKLADATKAGLVNALVEVVNDIKV